MLWILDQSIFQDEITFENTGRSGRNISPNNRRNFATISAARDAEKPILEMQVQPVQ